jgi:starch synthase (maltosyl-transferring)
LSAPSGRDAGVDALAGGAALPGVEAHPRGAGVAGVDAHTGEHRRLAQEAAASGRARVVLERATPEVDAGRFAVKRVLGDAVVVEVDAFTDGHDRVACALRWRHEDDAAWREAPMEALVNDRWRASFTVDRLGRWRYGIAAWIDRYGTWLHDLGRRPVGDADVPVWFLAGAALVREAAASAQGHAGERLREVASLLAGDAAESAKRAIAGSPETRALMREHDPRLHAADYGRTLEVVVDPPLARFGAWYEFFPRSFGVPEPRSPTTLRHGRFRDLEPMLDYVARLGFDILYFPPIHPIGVAYRKGPNNALTAGPGDVGSPWAIGLLGTGGEGGHRSIHPDLGTIEDFRWLVERAKSRKLEIALDVAFQCSPDHPYVHDHPEWFRRRPDGSIQYAENPPKKYQDIYPFDFESEDWPALWDELAGVFEFWIEHGVTVFRVDNPHTKAFPFWEYAITRVKRRCPEAMFLSEAFTRPKVMHRLAKLGFTQSYTYFTWRNTKHELTEYFTELAHGPGAEYFRPNVWPNTPDILPEYLQVGGRAAFMVRAVLATMLSATWGMYGPAFELLEHEPRSPGSEEYLDSEKYQLRRWDLEREDSLAEFVALLNRIRRESPALQQNATLAFHDVDNEQLLCWSKTAGEDAIVVVANLDPHHAQSGWITLPLEKLGLEPERAYQVHDLLGGGRFLWSGPRNYVALAPDSLPAHVFRVRRHARREQDFDYFL